VPIGKAFATAMVNLQKTQQKNHENNTELHHFGIPPLLFRSSGGTGGR
jgi:hypothetical protein